MPILVVCPSCKAEFNVSDKFAGKQGPCPKCKAPITIPKAEPAKAEVKIHAPEGTEGAKKAVGRPSTKPLVRQETKLSPLAITGILIGIVGAFAAAWFGAKVWQASPAARVAGLLVVSIPVVMAGYSFLRDDELEPYRGAALWLRASLCALLFTALWIGYHFVPADFTKNTFNWFFLAPPFFLVGAGVAFVAFDLDFGSGFFLYCFYLLITLALGAAAGLAMPWTGVTS